MQKKNATFKVHNKG